MPLTDEAVGALKAIGIDPTVKRWRDDAGDRIARFMEAEAIVSTMDEVQDKAKTYDEIVRGALGIQLNDDSLRKLVASLTGSFAYVQTHALSNGYVVCSARVERQVTGSDGEQSPAKFGARFLSHDPDTVRETLVEIKVRRTEASVRRLDDLLTFVGAKIPSLAGARQEALTRIGGVAGELMDGSE